VGYERTGDYRQALALGTAAATATAFSEGLGERKEILQYYEQVR
jgi:1-phosphofructokinase